MTPRFRFFDGLTFPHSSNQIILMHCNLISSLYTWQASSRSGIIQYSHRKLKDLVDSLVSILLSSESHTESSKVLYTVTWRLASYSARLASLRKPPPERVLQLHWTREDTRPTPLPRGHLVVSDHCLDSLRGTGFLKSNSIKAICRNRKITKIWCSSYYALYDRDTLS